MYLEICLFTALFACAIALALRPHRPSPSTARHSRDRYSVAAIRTRIETENAGQFTVKFQMPAQAPSRNLPSNAQLPAGALMFQLPSGDSR